MKLVVTTLVVLVASLTLAACSGGDERLPGNAVNPSDSAVGEQSRIVACLGAPSASGLASGETPSLPSQARDIRDAIRHWERNSEAPDLRLQAVREITSYASNDASRMLTFVAENRESFTPKEVVVVAGGLETAGHAGCIELIELLRAADEKLADTSRWRWMNPNDIADHKNAIRDVKKSILGSLLGRAQDEDSRRDIGTALRAIVRLTHEYGLGKSAPADLLDDPNHTWTALQEHLDDLARLVGLVASRSAVPDEGLCCAKWLLRQVPYIQSSGLTHSVSGLSYGAETKRRSELRSEFSEANRMYGMPILADLTAARRGILILAELGKEANGHVVAAAQLLDRAQYNGIVPPASYAVRQFAPDDSFLSFVKDPDAWSKRNAIVIENTVIPRDMNHRFLVLELPIGRENGQLLCPYHLAAGSKWCNICEYMHDRVSFKKEPDHVKLTAIAPELHFVRIDLCVDHKDKPKVGCVQCGDLRRFDDCASEMLDNVGHISDADKRSLKQLKEVGSFAASRLAAIALDTP